MGMFDYVKYEDICDKCDTPIPPSSFQTKAAGCNLDTLDPSEVDYFSGWCPKCNHRMDYEVERYCIVKSIKKVGEK